MEIKLKFFKFMKNLVQKKSGVSGLWPGKCSLSEVLRRLDEAAVGGAARAELARRDVDVLARRAPPVAAVQARWHVGLRVGRQL